MLRYSTSKNANQTNALVNDASTPLAAADLDSRTNAETNARVSKERLARARINASVEVKVGSVLVRARQAILSAERVARRWAKVRDHDDDAVASVGDGLAAAVGLDGKLPACTAAWTCAGTLVDCQLC